MTANEALTPPLRLNARRTIVRMAAPADVPSILRYYLDNREHLRPFDPERPSYFYEERFWRVQVRQNHEDLAADRALRLFIFPGDAPDVVIGNIGFSNIVRGVGHCCTLGYSIAAEREGQGLMAESLRVAIDYAFDGLHLHRVEANYLPHNQRSARLLRRLGFTVEGYSRDYLQINGRWEDHLRAALLNPRWQDGQVPRR
jgi:[ribosomal protein S5]-alanine N-acetyltransferase